MTGVLGVCSQDRSPLIMGVARRAPSIWPLMVIVALDSFALIAVSTLVQDVTIGFFNHGDQCIGQSSQVQSPGCRQGLSTTEKVSGWQAGISAVFAFILSPLMGAVSDAYGRVPLMMVILVFGTLLPTVVLVVSSYTGFTLWMYIAWRSVTYGFSSLAIAFAYVADSQSRRRCHGGAHADSSERDWPEVRGCISPMRLPLFTCLLSLCLSSSPSLLSSSQVAHTSRRTELFGYLMTAFSFGAVLAPLAATYLTFSESTVFAVAAGC